MDNRKGLVKRFSKKEVEKSEQISNDIAEGINGKHTVKQLRTAVAYYHDLFALEAMKNADLTLETARLN